MAASHLVYLSSENFVVTSFHQILFQCQRVTNEFVRVNDFLWQQLQFSVEFGYSILRQQKQQVQSEQLVLVGWFPDFTPKIRQNLVVKWTKLICLSIFQWIITCNRSSSISIGPYNARRQSHLCWPRWIERQFPAPLVQLTIHFWKLPFHQLVEKLA